MTDRLTLMIETGYNGAVWLEILLCCRKTRKYYIQIAKLEGRWEENSTSKHNWCILLLHDKILVNRFSRKMVAACMDSDEAVFYTASGSVSLITLGYRIINLCQMLAFLVKLIWHPSFWYLR